jgi:hypothetical protein
MSTRAAKVPCRRCGTPVPRYYLTSDGGCWDCMDGGWAESLGSHRQDNAPPKPSGPPRKPYTRRVTLEDRPVKHRFARDLLAFGLMLPLILAIAGAATAPATRPAPAPATKPVEPPVLWAVAGTPQNVQWTFDRTGTPGRYPLTPELQAAMLAATQPGTPLDPATRPATLPATQPTTEPAPPATNPAPPTPPPPPPVARFPPPAGSTAIYAGQPLPKIVAGNTVALERGGKWTGTVELRGVRPALVAFGDPNKPAPVIESPADADFCVAFFGNAATVTIAGIELRPSHPTAEARGDGLVLKGSTTEKLLVKDVWVRWFEQNITVTGRHHLPELNGVRSGYAWAPAGKDKLFKGQGLYDADLSEPLLVVGCLLAHNGYPDGPVDQRRNNYRHGDYKQFLNQATHFVGCIVANNACAGLQLREDGQVDDSLFSHNGINLLTASGRAAGSLVTVRRSAFVGAECYWTNTSWSGAMHLSAYAPTHVADCVLLRVPGATANLPVYQVALDPKKPSKKTASRAFELGAIAISDQHPDKHAKGHGSITFERTTVAGYAAPGQPLTNGSVPALTGDRARQTPTAGLTILPTAGSCDVSDLIAQAWIGGDVSALAAQGIARARAAEPTLTSRAVGSNVLAVDVSDGTAPYAIQWYRKLNSIDWTPA